MCALLGISKMYYWYGRNLRFSTGDVLGLLMFDLDLLFPDLGTLLEAAFSSLVDPVELDMRFQCVGLPIDFIFELKCSIVDKEP